MANILIDVILNMRFLAVNKVEIYIADREFTNQKTYTLDKALPTTKQVQIID